MPGNLLGSFERVVQVLHPALMPVDVRLMAQTQLRTHVCRALIIAEQDDFCIRVEKFPTLQRIALNHGAVAMEGLGSGEESDHGTAAFAPSTGEGANSEDSDSSN